MYLYGNLHQVSNLGDLDLIALCLLDRNILFVSLLLLIAVDAVMSNQSRLVRAMYMLWIGRAERSPPFSSILTVYWLRELLSICMHTFLKD